MNNDGVLEKIEIILSMDKDRPEDGYFLSVKDRAYRNEALIQIFSGLKRENQNKILEYGLNTLCRQIYGNEISYFSLLTEENEGVI